jgi:hypothetical protein
MDKKKIIFLMLCVLSLILSIFYIVLEWRIDNFSRDCKVNYNLNDSCPCKEPVLYDINSSMFKFFNISSNYSTYS